MKALLVPAAAAALLLGAPTASAADQTPVRQAQNFQQPPWNNPNIHAAKPRWSRGDRLPPQYRQRQYYVNDWQRRGFRRPPRGYRWVHDDSDNFFLALMATGLIADVVSRGDRDLLWREHYRREYTYNDDIYYRECRNGPDPAGVLAGAIIGGLLGQAAGHSGGATVAGVIFGGAMGAALTNHMDCEDRSYAYRTYYDGFNSGRVGYPYAWHNPRNDHRGEFRVRSYYNDPYGFRCANFSQQTYIRGRSYDTDGRACRQPDGTWAVVN